MASSSPPSKAIDDRVMSPQTCSEDVPFSNALATLEDYRNNNIALVPAMPEPEALVFAAQKANITARQALTAYLAIINYE